MLFSHISLSFSQNVLKIFQVIFPTIMYIIVHACKQFLCVCKHIHTRQWNNFINSRNILKHYSESFLDFFFNILLFSQIILILKSFCCSEITTYNYIWLCQWKSFINYITHIWLPHYLTISDIILKYTRQLIITPANEKTTHTWKALIATETRLTIKSWRPSRSWMSSDTRQPIVARETTSSWQPILSWETWFSFMSIESIESWQSWEPIVTWGTWLTVQSR